MAREPIYLVTEDGDHLVTEDGVPLITGYLGLDLELLLSAIVEGIGDHSDGQLVRLIAPAWWALEDLLQEDPELLFQLKDRKFEELLAGKYEAAGYRAILTPRSGDYGVDVIAESKEGPRVRIFDQAKRYSRGRLVPANDVRALMGSWAFRDATAGVVTTTSDFAPRIGEDPAIKNALSQGLRLINGPTLLQELAELRKAKG
ncbi:MAG: restriction endonuclease [Myxococcales bacterium]|nr:MAG: restriction endonuclease [Myxococcales bacterium]